MNFNNLEDNSAFQTGILVNESDPNPEIGATFESGPTTVPKADSYRAPNANSEDGEDLEIDRLASVGALYMAVAHDVRNPINVIKTSAYFLQSKLGAVDPRLSRHIELINAACNNAARIMDDFVRYASHRPNPRPVDLVVVANEAVRQCGEAGSRIQVTIDSPMTSLSLDRDLFVMAVGKLLQRSVAGSPPDSDVLLTVCAADNILRVQVEDSGPPLSEFQRQTLNQPLSASDSLRPTNLGLALVSEIARRQGGEIRALPREEGSLVTIEYPFASA